MGLWMDMTADAAALRRAVAVIRRRSSKPKGLWMRALTGTLLDAARQIETERDTLCPPGERP